jgi:hypothetical protein
MENAPKDLAMRSFYIRMCQGLSAADKEIPVNTYSILLQMQFMDPDIAKLMWFSE